MTAALPLAVVDIDGVLVDVGHRLHHIRRSPKDWVQREALRALARNPRIAVMVHDDPLVAELTVAGHPVLHATWQIEDRAPLVAQELEGRT